MGAGPSKDQKAKPEITFFDKPWRNIDWEDTQNVLQSVKDFKPQTEGQQIRILLYGPAGTGKSSFINSIQSILQERMYVQALADNISYDCFTKKFTTFKIPKGSPDTFYPFVFNDIMGLHAKQGVHVDDIKLALRGHVRDDYTFNPTSKMSKSDPHYNQCPTSNDKAHVLVCVVPADAWSREKDEMIAKMKEIREEASHLEIPQVAILTKIDLICPEVRDDVKKVYQSMQLKREMEKFSVDMGIPMNCIFPVKNYHEEIDLKSDVDALILSSLKHMINIGEDFINFKRDQPQVLDRYA